MWAASRGLGVAERVLVAALLVVGGFLAYHLLNGIEAERTAEFNLTSAAQGTTSFSLQPQKGAVSPGCGCPNPEYGKHPWSGMSVPSTQFKLHVNAEPDDEIANGLWSLTALAPNTGPINWYGQPNHSVRLQVEAEDKNGSRRSLFKGLASHFVLWTDRAVDVRQPAEYPYAAVLPAARGSTVFSSTEASRAQWGGTVDISSSTPARSEADPSEGCTVPEVGQRGPMFDVLGPTVRFSVPYTHRTRMWAALQEIPAATPGDELIISVTTPFAIRLIPHPVQREWQEALPRAWRQRLVSSIAESVRGESKAAGGILAQDRFFLDEALPPYSVHLTHLQEPSRTQWSTFATMSSNREQVRAMMADTQMDPLDEAVWSYSEYGLPPVEPLPEIGVFGKITNFDSTSVGGAAVIASHSQTVARGEEVHFESKEGIGAGFYKFTPLISSGQETTEASIAGTATVWIGGGLASHPAWIPWDLFGVIFGAIVGALVGGAVTAGLRWVRYGSLSSRRSEELIERT